MAIATQEGIVVLEPVADAFPEGGPLNPRLGDLGGKVVGFLDNSKLHPNRYFERIAERLRQEAGVAEVVMVSKPYFARPAQPHVLDGLAARCHAAITGVGE
ncbi:MAG: hypothetical protein ACE5JJ_04895 [Nitrospinota bacterium]